MPDRSFHSTGAGREQDEQLEERVTLYRVKISADKWSPWRPVEHMPPSANFRSGEVADFIPLTAHQTALRGLGEEIAAILGLVVKGLGEDEEFEWELAEARDRLLSLANRIDQEGEK